MDTAAANTAPSPNAITELLLTVEEAARRLSIGRTSMYALVSRGVVESVLIGRLRRIPIDALRRYVETLVTSQLGHTPA